MAIAIFRVVHSTLSVFTQTFFLHHAYGDTPEDPRSPRNYSGLGPMMMDTKNRYHDLAYGLAPPEPRFDGGYPE
jgi:stearoyl-CoA desaturase (delta-9 desaturase)